MRSRGTGTVDTGGAAQERGAHARPRTRASPRGAIPTAPWRPPPAPSMRPHLRFVTVRTCAPCTTGCVPHNTSCGGKMALGNAGTGTSASLAMRAPTGAGELSTRRKGSPSPLLLPPLSPFFPPLFVPVGTLSGAISGLSAPGPRSAHRAARAYLAPFNAFGVWRVSRPHRARPGVPVPTVRCCASRFPACLLAFGPVLAMAATFPPACLFGLACSHFGFLRAGRAYGHMRPSYTMQ